MLPIGTVFLKRNNSVSAVVVDHIDSLYVVNASSRSYDHSSANPLLGDTLMVLTEEHLMDWVGDGENRGLISDLWGADPYQSEYKQSKDDNSLFYRWDDRVDDIDALIRMVTVSMAMPHHRLKEIYKEIGDHGVKIVGRESGAILELLRLPERLKEFNFAQKIALLEELRTTGDTARKNLFHMQAILDNLKDPSRGTLAYFELMAQGNGDRFCLGHPVGISSGELPDGSGFMTGSFDLPKDHWLYNYSVYREDPQPVVELPEGVSRYDVEPAYREAIQRAVVGATRAGKEMDFDPDALVQNIIVQLFGVYTGNARRR